MRYIKSNPVKLGAVGKSHLQMFYLDRVILVHLPHRLKFSAIKHQHLETRVGGMQDMSTVESSGYHGSYEYPVTR